MIYSIVWVHTILFCSMWGATPPTLVQWQASCPSFNFGWGTLPALNIPGLADVDTWLFMRAVEIDTGQTACEEPVFHHLGDVPCPGLQPLDDYLLQIVWRDAARTICAVKSPTPPDPMTACPPGSLYPDMPPDAVLELRGPFTPPPPPTAEIVITPPPPDFTQPLATTDNLELLSYWLRWYNLGDPIAWQNRWDDSILGAGMVASVPPQILKAVIGQESQFWPMWTGIDGEVGLIQLTQDGADTALRHSPALYDRYCPLAIWPPYCSRKFDQLPGWQQDHIAAALLADLTLTGPPLDRAAQVSDDLVTYARILAAYYVYAAELGWPGWDYALAAYNAGGSCILTGQICPEGQIYLGKVKP